MYGERAPKGGGCAIKYVTKGAFHLSELTGQPIPIAMRIPLLIKLTIQISQILNIMHKGDDFQQNLLEKAYFITKMFGSAIGPTGQF